MLVRKAVTIVTDTTGVAIAWDPWTGYARNDVQARRECRFGLEVRQPLSVAVVELES